MVPIAWKFSPKYSKFQASIWYFCYIKASEIWGNVSYLAIEQEGSVSLEFVRYALEIKIFIMNVTHKGSIIVWTNTLCRFSISRGDFPDD